MRRATSKNGWVRLCLPETCGWRVLPGRALQLMLNRDESSLLLLIHFVTVLARLLQPGGVRGLVAENLLIKQQLLILNRTRRRAPNRSLVGCR